MPNIFQQFGNATREQVLHQIKNELSRRVDSALRDGLPMSPQSDFDKIFTDEWAHTKLMYSRVGITLGDLLAIGKEVHDNAEIMEKPEELPKQVQIVKTAIEKIARNEKCPCGSGLKYKKCCGR
jgi:hypothetical protein